MHTMPSTNLSLYINNTEASDSGKYMCQVIIPAISGPTGELILNVKGVYLLPHCGTHMHSPKTHMPMYMSDACSVTQAILSFSVFQKYSLNADLTSRDPSCLFQSLLQYQFVKLKESLFLKGTSLWLVTLKMVNQHQNTSGPRPAPPQRSSFLLHKVSLSLCPSKTQEYV